MNYSSGGTNLLNILNKFGMVSIIIAILLFIIHIIFVIFVMKMASQKGLSSIFYGILALIMPELAFIFLYNKDPYYDDEYGEY